MLLAITIKEKRWVCKQLGQRQQPANGHPLLQGKCSRPGGAVGCAAGGWGSHRLSAACRDLHTSPLCHTSERSREVWGGVCPPRRREHLMATWLKAWSLQSFPSDAVLVMSSQLRNPCSIQDKGWAQAPALLRTGWASLTALRHPQINSCRKRPQERNLGSQERSSHFLTNAAMEEDGWKHMRNIFVRSRKQMPFLQLPQKTGMNSSLPIGTVVPRNAAGENRQTSHSLAEAFPGRRDTAVFMPGLRAAKNGAHGWNKYSTGREGGGSIFLRSPNRYEELLLTVMEVESWY